MCLLDCARVPRYVVKRYSDVSVRICLDEMDV